MKKCVLFVLTLVLTLGLNAPSAFAALDDGQVGKSEQGRSIISDKHRKNAGLYNHKTLIMIQAKELGIETEGKEFQAIAKEVTETRIKQAATEFSINAEGKTIQELAKEVHHAKVKEKAAELGINSEGKDPKALAKEVYEVMLNLNYS